jgi:hypothetical protein
MRQGCSTMSCDELQLHLHLIESRRACYDAGKAHEEIPNQAESWADSVIIALKSFLADGFVLACLGEAEANWRGLHATRPPGGCG